MKKLFSKIKLVEFVYLLLVYEAVKSFKISDLISEYPSSRRKTNIAFKFDW